LSAAGGDSADLNHAVHPEPQLMAHASKGEQHDAAFVARD
jgi:hypothetical protein